ncbi:hypothetical protein JTB14_018433 [Gonioctena quinquepunctata]|nr:hypothetical protein JTB14_018433 [Gonioctena quinquepunctata]
MLMVHGKLQAYNSPDDLKNLWKALITSLNSCGDGPIRTLQEWKKVLEYFEWSAAVDGMNVGEFGIHGISLQNIEENNDDLVDPEEEMEGEIEGAIEEGEDIILQVVSDETKKKRTRKTTNDVLTNAYQEAVVSRLKALII